MAMDNKCLVLLRMDHRQAQGYDVMGGRDDMQVRNHFLNTNLHMDRQTHDIPHQSDMLVLVHDRQAHDIQARDTLALGDRDELARGTRVHGRLARGRRVHGILARDIQAHDKLVLDDELARGRLAGDQTRGE